MSLWNKIFEKHKEGKKGKLAWLGCDMHNHVLPGIDDGAKTVADSLVLIQGLKDLGIDRCIATPHVISGVYDNTVDDIAEALGRLKQELTSKNMEFSIGHSAEYMLDEGFLNILDHNRLCALPNNYVLIEMSYLAESNMLMEAIFRLQSEGYFPILAHPERYNYYHQDFNQYKIIKEMGALLQLNVLAISGYYGNQVKLTAARLIKEGMYDFVGTDMHHERHLNAIKGVVDRYDVEALLKHNPIKNATAF
ncbi:tyrosine-protein phosphatase [Sphingobacterium tabacisoli]|uniref:protein-tyrosine-phosphatase n=1 Tax=Sphingobacterium tabacisoli TaxID=2044855 RepID=A0ABW5L7A4_9SPHI|nr:CpsB/CapC family capsule biosynthesis tyrosine phosphatase [Sphingobacterium tabacisoli]